MSEPRRIRDLLAMARMAARVSGPQLTKLEVSPEVYAAVTTAHFTGLANLTTEPDYRPWLGVPVYVRDRSNLPPWARREHYSDGRVVTRYRLVMDPRVLQVRFMDQPYAKAGGGPERHGLSLQVRRFGWEHLVGYPGSAWKGARSCPYLPGLKALTDMAGLELTDWQRAYVTKAMHPDWRIVDYGSLTVR